MNRKVINELEEQASYGEGSPGEDLLSHQVDIDLPSHLRAQFSNLSLINANEIIITEDGHQHSLSAGPHTSTEDNTPPNTIYIIRTPTALQNFLTTQHPLASIKTIRLVLLHPIKSIPLTPEEQRGSSGPNITPVFAAWMQAFKLIPPTIQLIQLDISHSFVLRTLMLGKLAQHLSTTVYLRSERKARFEVVGAKSGEGKAFIEAGMVGLREGSAASRGTERLKVGAE